MKDSDASTGGEKSSCRVQELGVIGLCNSRGYRASQDVRLLVAQVVGMPSVNSVSGATEAGKKGGGRWPEGIRKVGLRGRKVECLGRKVDVVRFVLVIVIVIFPVE